MKWGIHFDLANSKAAIETLEKQTLESAFWNDSTSSQSVLKKLKQLKRKVTSFEKLEGLYDDALTLADMGIEAQDTELATEAKETTKEFMSFYENMRAEILLSGEYDGNNAILSLHPGAGGTESCDWTGMLLRMYGRWAEKRGFTFEILDLLDGDEAGIKSVTFQVSGHNAFGYLKSEKGIHRLIRLSPFDSSGKRHTSFASCDVMPELDDESKIQINPEDLKTDTFRSGGAGGQHVNKTESAVRITHIPSGIIVQCQNERSQIQNRDRAMKMLASRLYIKQQEEQLEKLSGIRGELKDNAWGSQIRTYVFHPSNRIKDHRTNVETFNAQAVMDGDLDNFMNAYLLWQNKMHQSNE